MSVRRLLRIGLSLGVVAALWTRAVQSGWSATWLAGSLVLTLLLLITVAVELSMARKDRRRPADDVPKRPLGLDV